MPSELENRPLPRCWASGSAWWALTISAGLSGLVARKRGRTTIRVPGVRVADDLVERRFRPDRPDVLWVADIERHDALLDRAEMKGLRPWPVAAGRVKLGAA